jgi:hypothetical protein
LQKTRIAHAIVTENGTDARYGIALDRKPESRVRDDFPVTVTDNAIGDDICAHSGAFTFTTASLSTFFPSQSSRLTETSFIA